jgi:hypothetical protein
LRNIAVAMGNALRKGEDAQIRAALAARREHPSALVREHVAWALAISVIPAEAGIQGVGEIPAARASP